MKYIPFIIFALIFCIDTNAQEVISDLLYNRAYSNDNNYKSNSGELDLCNQTQIAFEITEIIKPTCDTLNGSIKIEITPELSEYQIYVNDSLITETAESSYEITNIGSGGFLIRVEAASALGCEQFITIDNEGEEPINPEIFVLRDGFCANDGRGRISKNIAVNTETLVYVIFDLKNDSVGTVSNSKAQRLYPGNYYVREQISSGSCGAYWGFTINEIPTNALPFLEDFSKELVYPNPNKWADKQAFINRTFANSPYTLGVATLDGLNEFGQPYRINDNIVNGSADTLTANPFCLDDFTGESLFLSFLYQPQGISDSPDGVDSLIVEILDSEGEWHEIWDMNGDSATNNLEFTQADLEIVDDTATNATFFFDGFQFRFRNTATITGLNDPWHLDYIRLNEDEFEATIITNDIAFVYDMQPLLKKYYSMPWKQFYEYQAEEFVDSIHFTYRNNDDDPNLGFRLNYDIFDLCDPDAIPIESKQDIGIPVDTNKLLEHGISFDVNELPDLGKNDIEENVVLRCNLSFDTGGDNLEQNDTLEYNQIFSNYFAYDDGTAEKAFGLLGPGAQLAIEYETNEPTTLQGIQIYFTHIVGDVSQNRFSIMAWKELDKDEEMNSIAREDSVIMSKSDLIPYYTNEIGGFTTYLFEEPIVVNDTFYIGIEQVDREILNIGLDYNNLIPNDTLILYNDTLVSANDTLVPAKDTLISANNTLISANDTLILANDTLILANDTLILVNETLVSIPSDTLTFFQHLFAGGKMFYNTNGIWSESILPGAVMIRPIVGERELIQTGISTLESMNLTIYPNPTNGFLNIDGIENLSSYNVNIYDMTGKQLQHFTQENEQINVSSLASGMYMIQITDNQNKKLAHSKFVKY